jgi:[histone H3]-lysine9 N-trimethyltransferase SUV39H
VLQAFKDAALPTDFRFIDQSVLGAGVSRAEESFRSGCECSENEDCMYDDCMCLEEVDSDSEAEPVAHDEDGDEYTGPKQRRSATPRARGRKKFAYHAHGVKAGLLRSKILQSREPIYECHEGCRCSRECPNRVVERGRTIPLQIFQTENRGWGVRSTVDIRRGQYVDRYLGEIITPAEADRRRKASDKAQRKDVYLFALDKFIRADHPDERLRGPPLEVDGEYMSGPTRFINHSCEPNMRIFARVGDHADKHVHDLALFAIEDIPAGTELTFDYVDGVEETDDMDPDMRGEMTVCLCGSRKCRKFLW